MASFAQFMGRRVTVQYRVGDVLLPASGTFAADSGRSIFLEQHVEQRGKRSYFRWEIPYACILSLAENFAPAPSLPRKAEQIDRAQRDGESGGVAHLHQRPNEA